MPEIRPQTARDFCLHVLMRGDLAAKLAPPFDEQGRILPLDPSGPAMLVDGPARDPGLRMVGGRAKLPKPGELRDLESRRLCLARFAHHELMAVEYFAWALLRWPELPPALRRGLLGALADEQRHCRLYLDRLDALGGHFDRDDHSDYFWRHAPAIAASPHGASAFLAAMGLTLEQANLDFTLTYRDVFAAAGDAESAAICQQVHDDEIVHVALAADWIVRLAPQSRSDSEAQRSRSNPDARLVEPAAMAPDLARYEATVPFPMAASRAKGRRFERRPRERAGLSAAFIEHVRAARSAQEQARSRAGLPPLPWILPNLGAEEGRDWAAYPRQPRARVAGRLFGLLFPADAHLVHPLPNGQLAAEPVATHWPPALGAPARHAVAPWLEPERESECDPHVDPPIAPAHASLPRSTATCWLNTPALASALARLAPSPERPIRLRGPEPACVVHHHDKRFALEAGRAAGLLPAVLDPLLVAYEPAELASPDRFVAELEERLARWPAWTGHRFTLKPRQGSSGRGRIAGESRADSKALRGALPRLAERGGAILEPWLERTFDLSVSLFVPERGEPSVLASFELLVSRSGVYRGHCGILDANGSIQADDRDDALAREQAIALARRAQAGGFFGPCGVDGFRFVLSAADPARSASEIWRGAVELNARPTMGTVAWGLSERLRAARGAGALPARDGRTALLFTLLDGDDAGADAARAIAAEAGPGTVAISLGSPKAKEPLGPYLFAAPDRAALRAAYRSVCGC